MRPPVDHTKQVKLDKWRTAAEEAAIKWYNSLSVADRITAYDHYYDHYLPLEPTFVIMHKAYGNVDISKLRTKVQSSSPATLSRHGVALDRNDIVYPYSIPNNPFTGDDHMIPDWLTNWRFKDEYKASLVLFLWFDYYRQKKDSHPISQWDFYALGLDSKQREHILVPPNRKAGQ